jgi:hypothetical protein
MRLPFLLCLAFASLAAADTDRARELAEKHRQILGGKDRLERFVGMRVVGEIQIEGYKLTFVSYSKRPNLVRNEIKTNKQLLIQGYDGVNPPWEFDFGKGICRRLSEANAREFTADAEFSDPLVYPDERGYTLKYLGVKSWQGSEYECVEATRKDEPPIELWLDKGTSLIARLIKIRKPSEEREITIETRFSDYRAVNDILLPFRFTVYADGNKLHETAFSSIEVNPTMGGDLFAAPEKPALKE